MRLEIRITRDIFLADRVLSVVDLRRDDGEWLSFGYCIEDTDRKVEEDGSRKVKGLTAIPTGTYKVKLYDSPKHGPQTPELINVPGYQHVQIHSGNDPEDTEGCLLLGLERTKTVVGKSKLACDWIKTEIIKTIAQGGEVYVMVGRA